MVQKIFGMPVVENEEVGKDWLKNAPIVIESLDTYRATLKFTITVKVIDGGFSARCDQHPEMYVEAPTIAGLRKKVEEMFLERFG